MANAISNHWFSGMSLTFDARGSFVLQLKECRCFGHRINSLTFSLIEWGWCNSGLVNYCWAERRCGAAEQSGTSLSLNWAIIQAVAQLNNQQLLPNINLHLQRMHWEQNRIVLMVPRHGAGATRNNSFFPRGAKAEGCPTRTRFPCGAWRSVTKCPDAISIKWYFVTYSVSYNNTSTRPCHQQTDFSTSKIKYRRK